MFAKTYLVLGLALLAFYGAAVPMGWEFGGFRRETAQEAQARRSSGGGHAYWYRGYWGGK